MGLLGTYIKKIDKLKSRLRKNGKKSLKHWDCSIEKTQLESESAANTQTRRAQPVSAHKKKKHTKAACIKSTHLGSPNYI